MSLTFSHRDKTGATLYGVIKDIVGDGKYWDNVAGEWTSTLDADCYVALSEGTGWTGNGYYTATLADFIPVAGALYDLQVYTESDGTYTMRASSQYVAPNNVDTLVSVVNDVRRECRFSTIPTGQAITDSFSLLIVQKCNDVLKYIVSEGRDIASMQIKGTILTSDGVSHYLIAPIKHNGRIESILYLNDANMMPLKKLSAAEFSAMAGSVDPSTDQEGYPFCYTVEATQGGLPIVKLYPTPDDEYTLNYCVKANPAELTAYSDYVPYSDIVRLGAIVFTKTNLGRDVTSDTIMFERALSSLATSPESNWLDGEVDV